MAAVERFQCAVREAVGDRPLATVATDAGLPRDAIRRVLLGHDPRLSRASAIAEALDLVFVIGSDRSDDVDPARMILELKAAEVEVLQALDRLISAAVAIRSSPVE